MHLQRILIVGLVAINFTTTGIFFALFFFDLSFIEPLIYGKLAVTIWLASFTLLLLLSSLWLEKHTKLIKGILIWLFLVSVAFSVFVVVQ
jgi:hypothetical protein